MLYLWSNKGCYMVVAVVEGSPHIEQEIEGLYYVYCSCCRAKIAINLSTPFDIQQAKKGHLRRLCGARLDLLSHSVQRNSQAE